MAHGEQQQQRQRRRRGAGAQAENQLREGLVAQDQVALEVNRQANCEQREHSYSQGVGRQRIEPKPAAERQQRDGRQSGAQGGIDHERWQQIDLSAHEMAHAAERSFPEHREEACAQNKCCIEPIHGNITHTSSSAFRFAASLTRAWVRRPKSTDWTSTTFPIGMPGGKMPPSPLVTTLWAGFRFAFLEIYSNSTNSVSSGPEAPITRSE